MRNLRLLLVFAIAAAAAGGAGAAGTGWDALKEGMTRDQVARSVGVPVLSNAGRGYETWIYDAGGGVQFRGGVVLAWTAPKDPTAAAQVPSPAGSAPVVLMPEIAQKGRRTYGVAQRSTAPRFPRVY